MKLRLTQDHSKEWHVDRSIGEILLRIAPALIEIAPAEARQRVVLKPNLVWEVQGLPTGPRSFEWIIRVRCLTCKTFTKITNFTGKSGKPLHSCCGETVYAAPPEIVKEYFQKKKPRDKADNEAALAKFLSNPAEWDGETLYTEGNPDE